jgi:hydrogenase expression/formation protein HypC
MCLSVPMKILEVEGTRAVVELGGATQEISIVLVDPPPVPGQYAIVHAGFALNVIDEDEARENLALLEELAEHHQRELDARGEG